jgi:hypothetical protein
LCDKEEMPTVAITGFIGAGTTNDPFRPDIDDAAIPRWAIIDLRPDATVITGACVVIIEQEMTITSSTGETLLQTTNLNRLNQATARTLASRLGLDPLTVNGQASIGELIERILGVSLKPHNGVRRVEALGFKLYEGV